MFSNGKKGWLQSHVCFKNLLHQNGFYSITVWVFFLSFKIDMIYYFILYQYCTFNHNFLIKICLLFLFCVSAKLHPSMHKWTLLLIGNNEMQSCLNTKMYNTFQPTNIKKKPVEIGGNSKILTSQSHTVFFYWNTYCLLGVYFN